MRLRALGISEVQPKVGGLGFVRAHQTSVVEALGSVQGLRGPAVGEGGGERLFGRGSCLTNGAEEEEWESGYNLVAVLLVSARQGKAQQRAAKAKPAQICGSPRVGSGSGCREGGEVQTGRPGRWAMEGSGVGFVNNGGGCGKAVVWCMTVPL